METATIIVIFVSSLLVTTYSVYTFGPFENLRDPFEEHED
jgi:hypothetical protein